jgi:hypothetical protein
MEFSGFSVRERSGVICPSTVAREERSIIGFGSGRPVGLFDRILERLHVELDDRSLIDYATWMVDSTPVRGSRAAVGPPVKKETPASPIPRALPGRADDQNPSCL